MFTLWTIKDKNKIISRWHFKSCQCFHLDNEISPIFTVVHWAFNRSPSHDICKGNRKCVSICPELVREDSPIKEMKFPADYLSNTYTLISYIGHHRWLMARTLQIQLCQCGEWDSFNIHLVQYIGPIYIFKILGDAAQWRTNVKWCWIWFMSCCDSQSVKMRIRLREQL